MSDGKTTFQENSGDFITRCWSNLKRSGTIDNPDMERVLALLESFAYATHMVGNIDGVEDKAAWWSNFQQVWERAGDICESLQKRGITVGQGYEATGIETRIAAPLRKRREIVTAHHIELCRGELNNYAGIDLKPDVMAEVILGDSGLNAQLKGWYDDPAQTSLDTGDRDTLFDAVGKFFVGERWPLIGDGAATNERFQNALKKAIADKNALTAA